jgi:hypothetical protein
VRNIVVQRGLSASNAIFTAAAFLHGLQPDAEIAQSPGNKAGDDEAAA